MEQDLIGELCASRKNLLENNWGGTELDLATTCFEKDLLGKMLGVEQSLIRKLCASIKILYKIVKG